MTRNVTFRLSDRLIARIDASAQRSRVDRSTWVRRALEEELSAAEQDNPPGDPTESDSS